MASLFKKHHKKPNLLESKFKTLLYISIFGWIILLVGQVVDNVLAGNFIGEQGLSAVQIMLPFQTFISALGGFAGTGFAVMFSQLKGKQKEEQANKIVGLGLLFTLLLGIITALLLLFLKEPLLSIFNMSNQVKEYVYEYYDWYIGIAIVQPIYLLLFKLVSQDGDPLFTVISSVGQVVINFVLSAILIKNLGIKGLSIGTFIAVSSAIVLVSLHFLSKKNSIKFRFTKDIKQLKYPFIYGFPALLGNLSMAIVNLSLNAFITNKFGDAYLASFTLVIFVSNLKLAFACISDSLGAFLSTAKGSGNNEDIKLCFKLLKKHCVIISLALTTIVMALCAVIPNMFKVVDSLQKEYATMASLIIAPTFICYAFTINLGATYTAIGKPKITLINQIISNLVLPILLPIVLSIWFNNYYGIIWGFAISAATSIGIMAIALAIIHKPHRVFIAPDIDEQQFGVDMFVNDEYIPIAREEIITNLNRYDIEERPIKEILDLYDQACIFLKNKNPDKLVTVRMVFSINKERIKLLSKNNGRILSLEEKLKEVKNNEYDYSALGNVYESNSLSLSTMISFNSQTTIINRY